MNPLHPPVIVAAPTWPNSPDHGPTLRWYADLDAIDRGEIAATASAGGIHVLQWCPRAWVEQALDVADDLAAGGLAGGVVTHWRAAGVWEPVEANAA